MALLSDLAESKGRFLGNNILLAWCLVMAQIQFSLKKNKDWTARTLANAPPSPIPTPLRPITSHFCLTTPFPLPPSPHPHQSGRHMCISPHWLFCILVTFPKTVSIVRHYFLSQLLKQFYENPEHIFFQCLFVVFLVKF